MPSRDTVLSGLVATRAPARPNPIGLSNVGLLGIEGKDHSGILFYDDERLPAPAIGTLARAIVRAGQERRGWKNARGTLR